MKYLLILIFITLAGCLEEEKSPIGAHVVESHQVTAKINGTVCALQVDRKISVTNIKVYGVSDTDGNGMLILVQNIEPSGPGTVLLPGTEKWVPPKLAKSFGRLVQGADISVPEDSDEKHLIADFSHYKSFPQEMSPGEEIVVVKNMGKETKDSYCQFFWNEK